MSKVSENQIIYVKHLMNQCQIIRSNFLIVIRLNDISMQYEQINTDNDVIIICADDNTPLALETIGTVEVHFHVEYEK